MICSSAARDSHRPGPARSARRDPCLCKSRPTRRPRKPVAPSPLPRVSLGGEVPWARGGMAAVPRPLPGLVGDFLLAWSPATPPKCRGRAISPLVARPHPKLPARQRVSSRFHARRRTAAGTGGCRVPLERGKVSLPSRYPPKVTGPSPSSKGLPSPFSSKMLGPADSPPRSGLQRGGDLPKQLGES